MRYYAGIGSRKSPQDILKFMVKIAKSLSDSYILRSGGAVGADKAFEYGAKDKEIFRPEGATKEAIHYYGSCKVKV